MQLSYGMNDYEAKFISVDSKKELLTVLSQEYETIIY